MDLIKIKDVICYDDDYSEFIYKSDNYKILEFWFDVYDHHCTELNFVDLDDVDSANEVEHNLYFHCNYIYVLVDFANKKIFEISDNVNEEKL